MVIETAKLNVITAYDGDEALQCLIRFPKVDGIVVNADMTDDKECRKLISDFRGIVPNLEVIVISAGARVRHDRAEHAVDSLNPRELLECLQSPKKEATAEIHARESKMTE